MNRSIHVFCLLFLSLPSIKATAQCNLPPPQQVFFTNVKSCALTVNWIPVKNTKNYSIQYSIQNTDTIFNIAGTGHVSTYGLTGLRPNTTYKVQVYALCSNNKKGQPATASVTTSACATPLNLKASSVYTSSATLTWDGDCNGEKYKFSYKPSGNGQWKNISSSTNSITISGLNAKTTYLTRVKSTCSQTLSSDWSDTVSFTTLSGNNITKGKNVILILLDDSRQDSYQPSGGPSWFPSPNINRIANEGANFNLCYPAESQCAPSRASIVTGVYPNKHGIENNPNYDPNDTITLPTLAAILHDAGYYNGFIGKFQISDNPQPGYDYWMESYDQYFNSTWNVNGVSKEIDGHQTDVTTDSALGFIKKVPAGKNFFLFLAFHAPHSPYIPQYADTGLFDVDSMPIPADFFQYKFDYPSFLYDCHSYNGSSLGLQKNERQYFQLLEGVDQGLGSIFGLLDTLHAMDSTLIIFTSDNGILFGEHFLKEKQLAYKQSLHLPLYVRYPKLITAGTFINNQIASNIDFAPTILDFAGIDAAPYHMDGVSLLKMLNKQVQRKTFYYEFFTQQCTPDLRAIVTLNDKYVQYHCDTVTEELFDLNIDNAEDSSIAYNPKYGKIIKNLRDSLTYYRNFYDDTIWNPELNCFITNPRVRLGNVEEEPARFEAFPDPASTLLNIKFYSPLDDHSSLLIYDSFGKVIYENSDIQYRSSVTIQTGKWSSGIYDVCVRKDGVVSHLSVSVAH